MSVFSQLWKSVAEPIHTFWFGSSATYEHKSLSEPITIDGIATREEQRRRPNGIGGWDLVTMRSFRFSKPTSQAFKVSGVVSLDGIKYAIDSVSNTEGDRLQFELRRVEIGELTKPNYRG